MKEYNPVNKEKIRKEYEDLTEAECKEYVEVIKALEITSTQENIVMIDKLLYLNYGDITRLSQEYMVLNDENERLAMKDGAVKIAKFVKDNDIKEIIVLEKSGRPMAFFFELVWKRIFSTIELPKIYYLDPSEFAPHYKETDQPKHVIKSFLPELYKTSRIFNRILNKLNKVKEKSILILDDFFKTGEQLDRTKKALKSILKIDNIYTGAIVSKSEREYGLITPDVYGPEVKNKTNFSEYVGYSEMSLSIHEKLPKLEGRHLWRFLRKEQLNRDLIKLAETIDAVI